MTSFMDKPLADAKDNTKKLLKKETRFLHSAMGPKSFWCWIFRNLVISRKHFILFFYLRLFSCCLKGQLILKAIFHSFTYSKKSIHTSFKKHTYVSYNHRFTKILMRFHKASLRNFEGLTPELPSTYYKHCTNCIGQFWNTVLDLFFSLFAF